MLGKCIRWSLVGLPEGASVVGGGWIERGRKGISFDTDRVRNLAGDGCGEGYQRDCGRTFFECVHGGHSPEEHLSQTTGEQCARSDSVCASCRHCQSGRILYLMVLLCF